jgi:hypothetical protein
MYQSYIKNHTWSINFDPEKEINLKLFFHKVRSYPSLRLAYEVDQLV